MPGHGDPYPLGWPWPAAIPEPYFTCKCNPPFEKWRDDENGGEPHLWAHRVPIDCMTAEDWQRVARQKQERAVTVWVVSVIGDEDCGAPNDGAIGVFENKMAAWKVAMDRASEITDDDVDVREDSIHMGYVRTVIEINEMTVQ